MSFGDSFSVFFFVLFYRRRERRDFREYEAMVSWIYLCFFFCSAGKVCRVFG